MELGQVLVSATTAAKPAAAPRKADRAAAYYHYALAHMYEEQVAVYGRSELANKAIEEYRQAIAPAVGLAGIVVDINLRSPQSVQQVRNKLRNEAYSSVPRLFVLADALHHGSMQAWALGATDTISRPFDAHGILQRIRAAFPRPLGIDPRHGVAPRPGNRTTGTHRAVDAP